jgi:hypothetical protein
LISDFLPLTFSLRSLIERGRIICASTLMRLPLVNEKREGFLKQLVDFRRRHPSD